jgi:hypothetical protein
MAGAVMTTATVTSTTVATVLLMRLQEATVRLTTTAVTEPPVLEVTAEAEAEINSSL